MKKILLAAFMVAFSCALYGQTVVSGSSSSGSAATALSAVPYTVATLPTGQQKGTLANVSNGNSATDCTAGGGTTLVTCYYTGSAWAAFLSGAYTLPAADGSHLGGVIVGSGLNVSLGTISATAASVGADASGAAAAITLSGLGAGSIATQAASAVAVTGGTINGTPIGGSTPAAGAFTTLSATSGFTSNSDGVHPGQIALPWLGTANAPPTNATGWEGYVGTSGTAGWFDLPSALPAATSFMEFAAVGSSHSVGSMVGVTGTGSVVLATSPTLVTPVIGAATGTSLLATGIVDGKAPITVTTGTTGTLGAATYNSGYTFNQEATAATGVTYTLPATAAGLQYCVKNSIVSGTGAADTGVLTVYPPASSYIILNGTRNTIGGGGTHGIASGGAAGDAACFVAIDSTDWEVYVGKGTWTAN